MSVLNTQQRTDLEGTVQKARGAAETAAADTLYSLAVAETRRPGFLSDEQNALRLVLRDKARQLGDATSVDGAPLTNLTREVAYEQWHRLLFARILEVNGLLRHPDYAVALTLEDCEALAPDLGELDGWAVAARFAAAILPGVFRVDDPAFQVRFSRERHAELEQRLLTLPAEVLRAEDALGWVYQFWQTAEDKRVRDSGEKIGGTNLPPVTQKFTEDYMIRFLLENSLGAWWASRHPESPLVSAWKYLRRLDDGTPAAGAFPEWPLTTAQVTALDPCCGSGHFLVRLFDMLWRMRAEEERLSPADAQDAVLRENLFGLELDPRCTQLATFNLALEAWKQGGFRQLPAPQVACSGVPVRTTRAEWLALAGGDANLSPFIARLHSLFWSADSLGSLIDPRPAQEDGALIGRDLSVDLSWADVRALLRQAMNREKQDATVLGHAADDVVHAASLLGRTYTLVATNPPYLGIQLMEASAAEFITSNYPSSCADLSTAMLERYLPKTHGTIAAVMPINWLFLKTYGPLRRKILKSHGWNVLAPLGSGAFETISGQVVQTVLVILSASPSRSSTLIVDARAGGSPSHKALLLEQEPGDSFAHSELVASPDTILNLQHSDHRILACSASSWEGLVTSDSSQFIIRFWEVPTISSVWERYLTAPSETMHYTGRSKLLRWEGGRGALVNNANAHNFNPSQVLNHRGVLVGQSGLRVTLYMGEMFNQTSSPLIPNDPEDLHALWAFASSEEYRTLVRRVNSKVVVGPGYLLKVPFDRDRWQNEADALGPLPLPYSNDPTQWLFRGDVVSSTEPLHVAVARLLGYTWPDQPVDALDALADADGILPLVDLPGEPAAAGRLRALLAAAYREAWSPAKERELVAAAGEQSGSLDDWLRGTFFAQHVKLFGNRPFLWQVWDGRADGFSAIVNYHRLNASLLEKLAFDQLGKWISRQQSDAKTGKAGADSRLKAAQDLQARLKLILEGEPPYDIYVRWRRLHEQAMGWEPDLDDGVRMNIRPFVLAGVLRTKVNVTWAKEGGKNPDGSDRINDLHLTHAQKREARRLAKAGAQ